MISISISRSPVEAGTAQNKKRKSRLASEVDWCDVLLVLASLFALWHSFPQLRSGFDLITSGLTQEHISVGVQPTNKSAIALTNALKNEGADVTSGPGNGRLACAWSVNKFALNPAFGRNIGKNPNLVVSVQAELIAIGSIEVPQSEAKPGDIVVAAGPGRSQHIGIVVPKRDGAGVEALSTGGGRFGWRSDLNFAMNYKVKGQIYRLPTK